MTEMDPYRRKLIEHMRRHLEELKGQLAAFDRVQFRQTQDDAPRVDAKPVVIKRLMAEIAKTERAIADLS